MPRASWRRFLRLSLVSCPIYLYFVRCVANFGSELPPAGPPGRRCRA